MLRCSKCGKSSDVLSEKSLHTSNKNTCTSDSITECESWSETCSESNGDLETRSCTSMTSVICSQGQNECSVETVEGNFITELTQSLDKQLPCNFQAELMNDKTNYYGTVNVGNSEHVTVGNVTCITGPVYVIKKSTNVKEESIVNQLLVNDSQEESHKFTIVTRKEWSAQAPLTITPLPKLARYVIIAHTATEEGYSQAENALLVKLIQSFHIDSRKWDDIAYNFLIGCDGNVYEGRGWNIQAAHTHGYNAFSIGIAFIGCFMNHLPPLSALNAAQELIRRGVELGHIPEDYTLIGHCQCTATESPGRQIYEEIKKWPHWKELSTENVKHVLF